MTMVDPFELAKSLSQSTAGAFERQRDLSLMDQILQGTSGGASQEDIGSLLARVSQGRQPQAQAAMQRGQQQHAGRALADILEKPELADQFAQLPANLQQEIAKGILDQKKQLMIQAAKAPEQPKLSQQTTQYLKDKVKSFEAADVVKDVGERMMGLVDSISAGKGTFQSKAPAMFKSDEVAEFESLTFDLLPHYKSMFPRGITNAEFKKISEGALPKLGLSPTANKARIQKFMDRADKVLKQKSSIEAIQDRLGFIPENISNLVSKDDEKETSEEREEKVGFEKLPAANKFPAGKKIRDNETGKIYESDGTSWKEVQE